MKENGVIRRRLSGREADPYIGQGRKILGEMKNIMRYGGIKQLSWTKDLQNGVRIIVSSIFGQDEVRILVPVGNPVVLANKLEFNYESSRLAIAGYTIIDGVNHATLWLEDEEPISLGFISGSASDNAEFGSEAFGVSQDGRVVVGSCNVFVAGENTTHAFRWTKETGMQDLGALSDDQIDFGAEISYATGISEDGTVITGSSQENITGVGSYQRAFRWTEETGMVGLGGRGGFGDPILGSGISRNGKHIVGRANNMHFTLQTTSFRYTDNSLKLMPFLSEIGNDLHVPYAASDNGIVVGYAGFFAPHRHAYLWSPDESRQISLGIDAYASDVSADGATALVVNSFPASEGTSLWTQQGGLVEIETFTATKMSAETDYIVGSRLVTTNISEAVKWSFDDGLVALKQLPGHQQSKANCINYISSKRKLEIEY